jgi:MtN3 and saliva related transmembrane protein
MVEAIGWVSSAILVVTIGKQVFKQWNDDTSKGVSTWLFIGQLAASVGFLIYSMLVRNWVFVVTNALMGTRSRPAIDAGGPRDKLPALCRIARRAFSSSWPRRCSGRAAASESRPSTTRR